jgi:hypothetical protein
MIWLLILIFILILATTTGAAEKQEPLEKLVNTDKSKLQKKSDLSVFLLQIAT